MLTDKNRNDVHMRSVLCPQDNYSRLHKRVWACLLMGLIIYAINNRAIGRILNPEYDTGRYLMIAAP